MSIDVFIYDNYYGELLEKIELSNNIEDINYLIGKLSYLQYEMHIKTDYGWYVRLKNKETNCSIYGIESYELLKYFLDRLG